MQEEISRQQRCVQFPGSGHGVPCKLFLYSSRHVRNGLVTYVNTVWYFS